MASSPGGADARKQQREAALVGEDSIPKVADVVISITLIGFRRHNISRYILLEHVPHNVVCTSHALYISLVTLELIQIKFETEPASQLIFNCLFYVTRLP